MTYTYILTRTYIHTYYIYIYYIYIYIYIYNIILHDVSLPAFLVAGQGFIPRNLIYAKGGCLVVARGSPVCFVGQGFL